MDPKKGQEERGLLPGLARVPLCGLIGMLISAPLSQKPLCFLSLEALSDSLVLGGLHQLLLLA